jgi:quercetin dioxygenase-like cupin family protein
MRAVLSLAAVLTLATPLYTLAQDHHATVQSDGLKWSAPAVYAPAGFKIQAHTHPNDENVTVLAGSFNVGTGDKLDESKGTAIKAGGYSFVPKGMAHYAWFTEDTVLQLHGVGPQGVTYVNPADDPRKK